MGEKPAGPTEKPSPPLFKMGEFKAHSGQTLAWKIECDMLTTADWHWAAKQVAERFSFRSVYGVPTGGKHFEVQLRPFIKPDGDYVLIVDDVLTTGGSMAGAKEIIKALHPEIPRVGVVMFARGKCPHWVVPLWQWPFEESAYG